MGVLINMHGSQAANISICAVLLVGALGTGERQMHYYVLLCSSGHKSSRSSRTTSPFSSSYLIVVVIFAKPELPMLSIYSYSAGIDFSRQNLTSVDVRFCRLKSIPAL